MKCPKCGSEMEKGYTDRGIWFNGNFPLFPLASGGIKMQAYRCPKCGKVELTTENQEV